MTACEPHELAPTFEDLAVEREDELDAIWRNSARYEQEEDPIKFEPMDPELDASFKGLDRSSIPATADSLVSSGIGLQVFLKHSKTQDQRTPMQAMGHQSGPAIMSYGTAIAQFHESEPAKARADSSPKSEQSPESSMEVGKIASLSSEEQWALLGPKKFLGYAALLARQYVKLVTNREEAKKADDSQPKSADEPVKSKNAPNENGWPPVEDLDWTGSTNWIKNCKDTVKAFGTETLVSWTKKRREVRNTVIPELERWRHPKDCDDGSAADPPLSSFYKGTYLGKRDLRSIGIKLDKPS